jgi:hypothetical protein
MNAFELVALIGAVCGIAMVLGGIWLIAKGALTFAATPKTEALTLEWKKQFRLTTQVPGMAFFLIGLLFVAVSLGFLKPPGLVPLEFEGEIKGVEEPVSVLVRPTTSWELPSTTAGTISGKIYPDLSVLVLVVNAPGYEPFSKSIKVSAEGRHVTPLGTLELHRKLKKSDLTASIADLPFNPADTANAAPSSVTYGVPQ